MKHAPPPPGDTGPSAMTLLRLQQLLDAYGASPERWPAEERVAALTLFERSAEARLQRDDAARLDSLLDLAPVVHPSAELARRILVAASVEKTQAESPGNRIRPLRSGQRYQPRTARRSGNHARTGRMRMWPSLIIAASLALAFWGVRTLTSSRPELTSEVIATLGVYDTPTDVLLQAPGFNILSTLPSVGCMDSELGCPNLNGLPEVESRSLAIGRKYV